MNFKSLCITVVFITGAVFGGFVLKTMGFIRSLPESLIAITHDIQKPQITDQYGQRLTVTYQNRWNVYNYVPLHDIPEFLQKAFILAEDKRFYGHHGVDWLARVNALWQNISAADTVRGASTITEQVIKMLHPRPRTLWSRWIEGIEASRLETYVTKEDILEFYLNQVPYASNRRGVTQAAEFYFDRDLQTLSKKEMIALAGLVRAPSYFDLRKNPTRISNVVGQLSEKLLRSGVISEKTHQGIQNEKFILSPPTNPIDASHFVNFLFRKIPASKIGTRKKITTTLDGNLQTIVQKVLDQRLRDIREMNVVNGAALVVDNETNEILVWTVAGHGKTDIPGTDINAVIIPRQPGSSMKPFLYAMALEQGWTAATVLFDVPLVDNVGNGLHEYHNYSRLYYGPVTVRTALGNSLNIPAVRAMKYIGVGNFLQKMQKMGMQCLSKHPDFYGDGLALGNGEVSLFELVQAYTVLARRGMFTPLSYTVDHSRIKSNGRIFSDEVVSIIGDILSDPEARSLEFGYGGLLDFPVQTAVKTGTSSDYRDAWAVGYNYHYTAGVWMGNLDGSETNGLTGAKGPAMVLRSIFSELNKNKPTRPLYLSPKLVQYEICENPSDGDVQNCVKKSEWFIRGTQPKSKRSEVLKTAIKLVQPIEGLQLSMDPRIPDESEAFEFIVEGIDEDAIVKWKVDNEVISISNHGRCLWPLSRGKHQVTCDVWKGDRKIFEAERIQFSVK